MRKAALLYNPLSGRREAHRRHTVEAAAEVLRAAGVEVHTEATRGAAEAGDQARGAIHSGCDTVFACGGDGTINDVLQGMVGTGAALAIIPLGTANTLAHDLQLPLHAVKAARAALTCTPKSFAVGRVQYRTFKGESASRYFTVAAGVGVDAHLFYRLNTLHKTKLGMLAYYLKATHLWLTDPLEFFDAEFVDSQTGRRIQEGVSELLAVRIRNFGGVLRELACGARLDRQDLRVVLFKTHSRLRYLQYIFRGLLGKSWNVPGIELVDAKSAKCVCPSSQEARRIFVEADGELLGTAPVEISITPDAFTLLVPAKK